MDEKHRDRRFRVIIVGGAIAGLTLAHCLKRAKIDYVLLESRDEIAPQVGASIGLNANGLRILDQLGMFDDILEWAEPLGTSYYWREDGSLLTQNEAIKDIQTRHGYPVSFLDRQRVLAILHEHLKEDRSRVLLSKRVVKIETSDSGAMVHCTDGSRYAGDLVVGADGIQSVVRQEMWRHMESLDLKDVVERERAKLKIEYSCIFGISDATTNLTVSQCHRTCAMDWSFLSAVGKDGRVYWFVFIKLDQTYLKPSFARFNRQDLDETVARFLDKPISSDVSFGDIYRNATFATHIPIEEAFFDKWAYKRLVCIGDSAHKMTPNMGQGANCAIESAASLVNHLRSLLKVSPVPSASDISNCLSVWERARQPRVKKIWAAANDLTRLESLATWRHSFFTFHALPRLNDWLTDQYSTVFIGSEKLEGIALPKRALGCPIAFDRNYQRLQDERGWVRLLWALPLVMCILLAHHMMGTTVRGFLPHLSSILDRDDTVRIMVTCFLPSITGSDAIARLQMLTFLTDIGAVYGIWLLDNYRRGYSRIASLLPVLCGVIFQFQGIGLVAPYYYLIDFLFSPLLSILVADRREMRISAAKTFLPVFVLLYYPVTWASFFSETVATRQWMNAIWQLFPVLVPLIHFLLTSMVEDSRPASLSVDQRADMPYVHIIWVSLAAISGLVFQYVRFSVPPGTSLSEIFYPEVGEFSSSVESFSDGVTLFLKYDELFSMASGFLWLLLCFRDLKLYGVQISLLKVAAFLAAMTWVGGPGAAFALGWGWREMTLTNKIRQS
ncbi:FAD-dependent oxidoreductase [Aspergillus clavatus NRRL 1]|uniref:FAD binding domain protein n=1 Tax=Aspergillus clavatus (strain ATCC 1007 / CBS 513.65 / DSM 816 / NCTC 3887 / NRRL 1 / QM 1276 / 107) TaxID=344612 RepID=A1CF95_ASPCL|nr:FAD binding domain protein [Aspergillus clavatus NRRL 1]EAW11544.1 FAD binding domain protein [Aspergillus clavatus NRRL 1]